MEPLKIGNIILPHRAVFGPMAGFTDAPCRRLMAQHGAGFTVSEKSSPAGEPDFWGTNPLSHGLRRASSPERGSLFICPKQASCG